MNNRIPISSARRSASLSTVTSKQRMHANSLAFSSMVAARITSLLCTGPMFIPDTGILLTFKKSRSASNDPRVDACTQTPRPGQATRYLYPAARLSMLKLATVRLRSITTTSQGFPILSPRRTLGRSALPTEGTLQATIASCASSTVSCSLLMESDFDALTGAIQPTLSPSQAGEMVYLKDPTAKSAHHMLQLTKHASR